MPAHARVAAFFFGPLLLLTAPACTAHAAERANGEGLFFTVIVESVRERHLEDVVVGTGTVAAWREMPISAEADGLAITEIFVDEGDSVRKGQLLARLNQRLLLAQLDQNRAVIAEIEAGLASARSDDERAKAVASGVISRQAIEQRETLVKTSEARRASAYAALEETRARLAQTEIVAPSDAIVASRSVALGQVVQAGGELFRLIQDGRIEVNALVPEADLFRIAPGQSARIVDPTGRMTQATVRLVAPVVDDRSRLGTVRMALQAETGLKPGMFVRVEIDAGSSPALTIPLKALVWREGKPAVFTVNDQGTATLRTVTAGRMADNSVEVIEGLASGERIVVEGAGLLNDGEKVRADVAFVCAVPGPP